MATKTKTTRAPQEPLHPQTGEPTNAARAARVVAFIRAYEQTHCGQDEPLATVVQDFLTDVYHYAAHHGLDVEDVSARALRMVEDERAQEESEP